MARKDADFILSDLEAGEVSLVPKAANKRKFLLLKMDDSAEENSDLTTEFDSEILKAELEETLTTPIDGEEETLKALLEKEDLSPRAIQTVRGMLRLTRGLDGELSERFLNTLNETVNSSDREKDQAQINKSDSKEDEEMAKEVTNENVTDKDPKAVDSSDPADVAKATETPEEVEKAAKAKKQEDDEEEMDGKKPPFLKNKDKMKKTEKADEDLDLDSLPESVRSKVQSIFKTQEDLEARNEEIRKEQEKTRAELKAERDARATEQEIRKAAEDYSHLPAKSEELGPLMKTAREKLSVDQVELLERVLKAADNAIATSKEFEEARDDTYELSSGERSALGQLQDLAKGYIEKAESGMSEAQAFAKAADANPHLYEKYLAEQRG